MTLVELIVSLTLMAIFALACTSLIVPIERSYRETVRLTRAQLLADTLVDSIRKECDDVKHDEKASVWIANFSETAADDAKLLSEGPGIKAGAGKGNALIFQRNNNYTEAIYACVPISGDNFTNVANNPLTEPNTAHAINALDNTGGENLKSGIVHFGYYQAKEDDRGVFPIQSYDYTNPLMASTYGEFTVKLEFSNLVLKDSKYPAYVQCKVSVYLGDCNSEKNKLAGPYYTRTTVVSFSANGSGSGSGSHTRPVTDKDVSITIKWKDSQGAAITWPDDVASINVQLAENDGTKKTHTLLKGQSRFVFANVNVKGTITVTSSELEDYEYTVTGSAVSGYVITYQSSDSDLVKLVSGPYFDNLISPYAWITSSSIIFGKYDDYASKVKGIKGTNVSIKINAKNDANPTDDYKLYIVPYYPPLSIVPTSYTLYILSEDGRFVANENCEGMFKDSRYLTNITGMDNVDTYRTTNMKDMFKNCIAMTQFNMPHLIKDKCQTTEGMFDGCYFATHFDFSSCDSSGVKNMSRMFCDVGAQEIDLSGLDFDSVTVADEMFAGDQYYYNHKLKKITLDGKSSDSASGSFVLSMPKCTSAKKMFAKNYSLTTFNGKLLLPSCTDFSSGFNDCYYLKSIDLSNSNFDKCNKFAGMFDSCINLTKIRMDGVDLDSATSLGFLSLNSVNELYMTGAKLSSVSSLEGWYQQKSIEKIVFSDCKLDSCLSTKNMFYACTNLNSIDMSGFETPVCTDMNSMFNYCLSVTSIDVSGWDTHSVQDMSYMFKMVNGRVGLNGTTNPLAVLDVSDFDFSSCTTLYGMFSGEYVIGGSRNLKKVIVSTAEKPKSAPNVTTAQQMFYYCSGMEEVVMDSFSMPACTTVKNMFTTCSKLKKVHMSDLITTGCSTYDDMFSDTAAVEEMYLSGWQPGAGLTSLTQNWLFRNGTNRKNLKYVDISNWSTPYLVDMENAFACDYSTSTTALTEVKMVGFDAPKLTEGKYAFRNCKQLTKVDMTDTDLSKVSLVNFFENTKALTTVICSTNKSPSWTGNSFKGSKISEKDVIYVS